MSKLTIFSRPHVAVAYLRASTEEQRLSPQAQRACIKSWAARERVRVAAWHVDRGVCSVAPFAERPALGAALGALRTHRAGLLVVARRDRIARDVVLAVQLERDVARAGARLVSAAGEGNGDSPADAFLRVVLDGAAQYEHGLIRARTRAALAAKRAHGECIGAVPYGFALGADGRRLVVQEREQAAITRTSCVWAVAPGARFTARRRGIRQPCGASLLRVPSRAHAHTSRWPRSTA
jgi:DNA invertase Pin-like site-specific DNA recombinase